MLEVNGIAQAITSVAIEVHRQRGRDLPETACRK